MNVIFDLDIEFNRALEEIGLSATKEQIETMKEIFDVTMKNQERIFSNYAEKQQLVNGIIQNIVEHNVSKEETVLTYSDISHMEVFETFIGEGTRDKIISSITNAGLPLDILKGIEVKVGGDTLHPLPGVTVDYNWAEDAHGSIYLEYLRITMIDDEGNEVIVYDHNKGVTIAERKRQQKEQRSKGRVGEYEAKFSSLERGKITEWHGKNGKIYYRDAHGYPVKVVNGRVVEKPLFEVD